MGERAQSGPLLAVGGPADHALRTGSLALRCADAEQGAFAGIRKTIGRSQRKFH